MTGEPAAAHWRDRRVLLTGATGLVGAWVLERLLELEADPVCLVRDWVPRSQAALGGALDRSVLVQGALEDQALLERALNEYEVQTVIHLGAQTIVGIANASPLSTFDANVRGTWNLLEACRRSATVSSLVVASSDKAYGDSDQLPYEEDCPLQGRHPYDVSKSCADLLATSYHHTYGLPLAITRCGNFFGGGDLNFSRIVPGSIRSALRGERPVVRSDGASRRDYVYVEEAAHFYLQLAEQVAWRPELHGHAFNFSCEQPRTVLEMVAAILERCHRPDLEPVVLGRSENEIRHQYLSAGKAHRMLGWRPVFGFADGLDRTIAWYRALLAETSSGMAAHR